jgi:histidine triad (HIT) family protein
MATIFTKIVNGEIPCYKVAENEEFLAFLDISPLTAGHTLVIPKKEVDYIFDLDEETYQKLWSFAKTVAKAVEKAVPCKRIVVSVIGIEVPHTHIHLIPLNTMNDCNFSRPKLSLPAEEMKAIAEKIREQF